MAKNKISEYSNTAASNTDVANINIAEGCSPSNINNAIRGVMAHLKDFQAGNVTGNALAIAGGGTNAENATDARTNLSAAKSGANSDITSLTGLTTPLSTSQGGTELTSFTSGGAMYATSTSALTTGTLPVASGGTGSASLTANNVLLGNGTSAFQVVAPSTSGNVLTSNGTTWQSEPLSVDKLSTASGSAPSYSARAWVNFNGTGTVAINESGNISSITDNGTGDYTANFTNAMPDANYSIALCLTAGDLNETQFRLLAANVSSAPTLKSTTQVRVSSATDIYDASISIFR
jgi:hypothetical protein